LGAPKHIENEGKVTSFDIQMDEFFLDAAKILCPGGRHQHNRTGKKPLPARGLRAERIRATRRASWNIFFTLDEAAAGRHVLAS
jgi:hypothetical protein